MEEDRKPVETEDEEEDETRRRTRKKRTEACGAPVLFLQSANPIPLPRRSIRRRARRSGTMLLSRTPHGLSK